MALSQGYYNYIHSDLWYQKRERWLKMANYECEWCSRICTTLHIHHLTYENFMNESDDDIVVLCKPCHKHADIIRKLIKGRENEPVIQSILDNRGYPFDMKLKSRKHVIKLKRRLKKVIKTLDEIYGLDTADEEKLKACLRGDMY